MSLPKKTKFSAKSESEYIEEDASGETQKAVRSYVKQSERPSPQPDIDDPSDVKQSERPIPQPDVDVQSYVKQSERSISQPDIDDPSDVKQSERSTPQPDVDVQTNVKQSPIKYTKAQADAFRYQQELHISNQQQIQQLRQRDELEQQQKQRLHFQRQHYQQEHQRQYLQHQQQFQQQQFNMGHQYQQQHFHNQQPQQFDDYGYQHGPGQSMQSDMQSTMHGYPSQSGGAEWFQHQIALQNGQFPHPHPQKHHGVTLEEEEYRTYMNQFNSQELIPYRFNNSQSVTADEGMSSVSNQQKVKPIVKKRPLKNDLPPLDPPGL